MPPASSRWVFCVPVLLCLLLAFPAMLSLASGGVQAAAVPATQVPAGS